MYCKHCGTLIPEESVFCPECGGSLKPTASSATPTPQDCGAAPEENRPSAPTVPDPSVEAGSDFSCGAPLQVAAPVSMAEKQSRSDAPAQRRRQWIIAGGCLLLALIILIPLCIHAARQKRYDAAMAMLQDGQYETAAAEFLALRDFSDAPAQYEAARNHIAYDAADALRQMGDYLAAKDAFLALSNFEDALERAAECQNAYDYAAAAALRDAGQQAEAMAAFLALDDYSDAKEQARLCGFVLDYAQADALMDAGSYKEAAELLVPLSNYNYRDSFEKLLYCNNRVAYAAAEALYQEGLFYSAQLAFKALIGFEDAEQRAEDCIQKFPKASELYHNPDFKKKSSHFKVDNRKGSFPIVYRLYTEDGTLVSTFCIPAGGKYTVKVPAGTYVIYEAGGYDWFGGKEFFGDEGYYQKVLDSDGSDTFKFRSGYILTFTMNVSESQSNLGAEAGSRDGF